MIFDKEKIYKNVVGVTFGGKDLHVARLETGLLPNQCTRILITVRRKK